MQSPVAITQTLQALESLSMTCASALWRDGFVAGWWWREIQRKKTVTQGGECIPQIWEKTPRLWSVGKINPYKWPYKLVSYRIIPPYKWSYSLLATGFWMFFGPFCRWLFRISELSTLWAMGFGWSFPRFAVLLETLGLVREILLISLGFVYGGFLLILPWYSTMKTTGWGICVSSFFQASNMQIQGFQMLHPGWWIEKTLLWQHW